MAKNKKASIPALIRSDKNLLGFGLFAVALLIAVLVYFDSNLYTNKTPSPIEAERTYRVETAPAALEDELIVNDPSDPISTQEIDYGMDY